MGRIIISIALYMGALQIMDYSFGKELVIAAFFFIGTLLPFIGGRNHD